MLCRTRRSTCLRRRTCRRWTLATQYQAALLPCSVSLTRGVPYQAGPAYHRLKSIRIAHLIPDFMRFCKFYISSCVDPNLVIQILLGSWWSVVFRKKYDISICSRVFGGFKLKLEMCFWMHVNLFILYLGFLCSKNYEIFVASCSW